MVWEFYKSVRRFFRREEGATTLEYALLIALIAGVCWFAVTKLGINLKAVFVSLLPKSSHGKGED